MNNSIFLHDVSDRISAGSHSGLSPLPSRHFWVVLATCAVSLTGCFLLTLGTVEYHTRRWRRNFNREILLLAKPARNLGCAQREVFKGFRYGASFAFHADLALRGALVVTFCAASYAFEFLFWWNAQGWSMSYVVVIVAFTLYLDLGSTVALAWTGFYGTLLPVLNCWFMFYLYPDGVKNDDIQSKVFGWVNFLAFLLLMFGLGFATNAKMYALSWQAYFSMCFLNPFDRTYFSHGLNIHLHAAETGALMGTLVGCVFSVGLAASMKTSALAKAQDMMLEVTWSQGHLLEQLLEMGCLRMRPQAASVFAVEVQNLQSQLEEVRDLLRSSWWECFDLGAAGQSRLRLEEMCRNLDFLTGWLESMVMAVQHAQLSGQSWELEPHSPHLFDAEKLLELIQSTRSALQQSCRAAVRGFSWDAEEESNLDFWLSTLEDGQHRANEAVKRRLLHQGWPRFFTSAHLPQFALASSASGYSQKVADLLIAMAEFEPADMAVGPCKGFLQGLLALPGADLRSWAGVWNCLKLLLTFTLCFVVGWFGIGMATGSFVPAFNATPAGTVAYLIFQGGDQAAALKKNMDRFMGVAFGSLMGTLTVGICGSLKPYIGWNGTATVFLVVYFSFEYLAFFVYFSSATFFYAGLMFCCFYANSALRPVDGQSVDHFVASGGLEKPEGVRLQCESDYQNILSQLVAILIATLMDVLADVSLSIRATAKLESFAELVDEALSRYPASTRAALELRREGRSHLQAAMADGAEAAREPRCLGVPWRQELWGRVMKVCNETWQCLTLVTVTEKPVTEQERSLQRCVEILGRSATFKEELQRLRIRTSKAFLLTMGFLRQSYYDERSSQMMELQEELVQREPGQLPISQIIAELRPHLSLGEEEEAQKLLDNQVCTVAMFLMMLEALVHRVAQLETAILEQPEVWQLLTEKDLSGEDSTHSLDSAVSLESFCV